METALLFIQKVDVVLSGTPLNNRGLQKTVQKVFCVEIGAKEEIGN